MENTSDPNILKKVVGFIDTFYICIFCIGIPVNCLAIYGFYRHVRIDNALSVCVINLLTLDLLQTAVLPLFFGSEDTSLDLIGNSILTFGVLGSICFLVCITLERYLAVVYPVWYRCHRSPKYGLLLSVSVWLGSILMSVIWFFSSKYKSRWIWLYLSFCFPVPLLLIMVCYVRIRTAILGCVAVPGTEKRRILLMLSLVLVLFTGLFGPLFICRSIYEMLFSVEENDKVLQTVQAWILVSEVVVSLNPLLDPILYSFFRDNVRESLMPAGCVTCFAKCCKRCRRTRAEGESAQALGCSEAECRV
ncbi:somatostatin receptor type 5-like [Amia ocellicauda]|uniref:somatostatin receptor type 5-like n=1 Tax=Amia ocellicauda TaxID=2972642 RepID=UPI003463FDAF